jgi:division protein CdvB (Snf7/Vps24/ESCRT-III family)
MEEEVERRFQRIEGLLATVAERQAAAEERANRADARMDRVDARMDRMDARSQQLEARFEKRMRGFEKLAKIGMKEIVEIRRLHRENEHKINALIDSQQRTETALRAFLKGLGRGGNGHQGGQTR